MRLQRRKLVVFAGSQGIFPNSICIGDPLQLGVLIAQIFGESVGQAWGILDFGLEFD
ncbi:hypothetical protein RintRC_1777 [Richelia intracellularis]|nr:hypothetical protein RintRC_1777 [Richelia intracellularis]